MAMGNDIYLSLPAGGLAASGELSDAEVLELQSRLWLLLSKRTQLYTGGESSSVTVETAQELLSSVWFTLDVYLRSAKADMRLLLGESLDSALEKGQRLLEAKVAQTRARWNAACLSAPKIDNISYRDTLRSIGGFFDHYDFRYLAHLIPCDIDYQLCHPVPEERLGVEYVEEYLRRIISENTVLGLFKRDNVLSVLDSAYRDYRELLVNLCEPIIINAVGLTLIGREPFGLLINDADRRELVSVLETKSRTRSRKALLNAAERFCMKAGISDDFTIKYITQTAEELYPRIEAALPLGDLSGIFV